MWCSMARHQKAMEGLARLQDDGGISFEVAERVQLLLGNCGDETKGVPQELLKATHLILTMRRMWGDKPGAFGGDGAEKIWKGMCQAGFKGG